MKSNLAILSSNKKSIDFVNGLSLKNLCNLYANCSRNVIDAEKFSKEFGFSKYYGSYEDLINDKEIDVILNFLPSGIKFEYSYLSLKRNIKVITDYPIICSKDELSSYEELIKDNLLQNLFLIDNCNIKRLANIFSQCSRFFYYKSFNDNLINNSLSNIDILYELSPDLFYILSQYRKNKIKIKILDIENDKITQKINFLNCHISIDNKFKIHVLLNNSNKANKFSSLRLNNVVNEDTTLQNVEDLFNFIKSKKPFDNLSEFQYYPFKLFQEVLHE